MNSTAACPHLEKYLVQSHQTNAPRERLSVTLVRRDSEWSRLVAMEMFRQGSDTSCNPAKSWNGHNLACRAKICPFILHYPHFD